MFARETAPHEYKRYKIYDFVFSHIRTFTPFSIDYMKDVSIKLSRKNEFNDKGFLTKVTYYESQTVTVDPTTLIRTVEYDNEILKVEINYNITSDGYVSYRDTKRSYMLDSDIYEEAGEITKRKHYDTVQALKEGLRRRQNVIDGLKLSVAGVIYITEATLGNITNVIEAEVLGIPAFTSLTIPVENYISGNTSPELIASIDGLSSVTFPWLDNVIPNAGGATVKQYAMSIISNAII